MKLSIHTIWEPIVFVLYDAHRFFIVYRLIKNQSYYWKVKKIKKSFWDIKTLKICFFSMDLFWANRGIYWFIYVFVTAKAS